MPLLRAFKRLAQNEPSDPLTEFLPESASERRQERERSRWPVAQEPQFRAWRIEPVVSPWRNRLFTMAAVGAGLVVGVVITAFAWRGSLGIGTAPVIISQSTVTLTSAPDGAEVFIDGAHAGNTPLSLSLRVGVHTAELRRGTSSRRTSLNVEAGKIVTQHVDFGAAPATGELLITSDPPGAHVAIDGTLRGLTPLNVPEVAPGQHRLTISSGRTSVERTVDVTAGAAATVVVSVPVVVENGWVTIDAPMDLEIYEAGRHLGSGRTSRISLAPGQHTLELVNQSVAFRRETTVTVVAGRSVALTVPMANGSLSINALPWAEVWVDGKSIGQTPIGNLSVSIGKHEVVWRHPEHGERRQMVLVSAAEPVRLGIDWTR